MCLGWNIYLEPFTFYKARTRFKHASLGYNSPRQWRVLERFSFALIATANVDQNLPFTLNGTILSDKYTNNGSCVLPFMLKYQETPQRYETSKNKTRFPFAV